MIRKIQFAIIILLISTISFGQNKKAVWPEMKSFHAVMAATFHPAEEGNLVPFNTLSDSLLNVAKRWQASPIPSSFKQEETKTALISLVNKCQELVKSVMANSSDDIKKKKLAEAHDIFHKIVGECQKSDDTK